MDQFCGNSTIGILIGNFFSINMLWSFLITIIGVSVIVIRSIILKHKRLKAAPGAVG